MCKRAACIDTAALFYIIRKVTNYLLTTNYQTPQASPFTLAQLRCALALLATPSSASALPRAAPLRPSVACNALECFSTPSHSSAAPYSLKRLNGNSAFSGNLAKSIISPVTGCLNASLYDQSAIHGALILLPYLPSPTSGIFREANWIRI